MKMFQKLFKKKRQCQLIYNKSREKYYGVWDDWPKDDDEVLIDEHMTEDEAGDMAKSLNQELGKKLYYYDAVFEVSTKHRNAKEKTTTIFESFHDAKEHYEQELEQGYEECYIIMYKDGAMTHLGGHGVIEF